MSHLRPAARSPAPEHRNSLVDHTQPVERRNHQGPQKRFVLCFDGTGNKFSGGPSDSNILKIYRMLDRNDGAQFHYYQPGIGTYVVSTSFRTRLCLLVSTLGIKRPRTVPLVLRLTST